MRFKLLGAVALTAGALAFGVTPAFAATASGGSGHSSSGHGSGGSGSGGSGGSGHEGGGSGGSGGSGHEGSGGGGSNDGKGYTLTGCSWDQQYTNHNNCYDPKPAPKPAPKNYWEQDWNLSWGQHNGHRYPVITESWGWNTHPVCLTEGVTFDFPHGTNVLTEVSGPVLHNGELAVYGGHDYVIENVHGTHFSVEAAGSWSLLTNTGTSIWNGHAVLPCLI